MPYSIVHIDLALQKNRELKLEGRNLLDFLVGNILVDSSYDLSEFGIELSRPDTHYHPGEDYFIADFPNNFYTQEIIGDEQNYLKLGYYYHLLVDMFRRDNEISEIYTDDEVRNAFQISRKLNAKQDFEKFLKNDGSDEILRELYDYKFIKNNLPKVFQNIDINIMQGGFKNILDYMTGKTHFIKGEYSKNTDKIISKHFYYDKHVEFKNRALSEIKL